LLNLNFILIYKKNLNKIFINIKMEYAEFISYDPENKINDNYTRYVGYQDTSDQLSLRFFSEQNVKTISDKLTQLLKGVDPLNRDIIIPDESIKNIMDSVYNSFRPQTGDIFSRYIIPNNITEDDYVQSFIDQTIEIIFSDVKNNLAMDQYNKSLSAWVQVYGDFNDNNLRAHPVIKILNKHPVHMQFNMNY
jgi:hypothetical protein